MTCAAVTLPTQGIPLGPPLPILICFKAVARSAAERQALVLSSQVTQVVHAALSFAALSCAHGLYCLVHPTEHGAWHEAGNSHFDAGIGTAGMRSCIDTIIDTSWRPALHSLHQLVSLIALQSLHPRLCKVPLSCSLHGAATSSALHSSFPHLASHLGGVFEPASRCFVPVPWQSCLQHLRPHASAAQRWLEVGRNAGCRGGSGRRVEVCLCQGTSRGTSQQAVLHGYPWAEARYALTRTLPPIALLTSLLAVPRPPATPATAHHPWAAAQQLLMGPLSNNTAPAGLQHASSQPSSSAWQCTTSSTARAAEQADSRLCNMGCTASTASTASTAPQAQEATQAQPDTATGGTMTVTVKFIDDKYDKQAGHELPDWALGMKMRVLAGHGWPGQPPQPTTQECLQSSFVHAVNILRSCGGMRGLMDMLSSRSAQKVERAVVALCYLVAGSEARKDSVAAAGAIPLIVNLLSCRPTNMHAAACRLDPAQPLHGQGGRQASRGNCRCGWHRPIGNMLVQPGSVAAELGGISVGWRDSSQPTACQGGLGCRCIASRGALPSQPTGGSGRGGGSGSAACEGVDSAPEQRCIGEERCQRNLPARGPPAAVKQRRSVGGVAGA